MARPDVPALVAEASALSSRSLVPLRVLRGGQHALTVLVSDGVSEYVVRGFPAGDAAVAREVQVLRRLASLGPRAPRLLWHTLEGEEGPVIVTTRVAGGMPSRRLDTAVIAEQMALVLAAIHQLPGDGLPPALPPPGAGSQPVVALARQHWTRLVAEEPVLTHHDFWCGNALWDGDVLTGVVDWSGARHAPRGVDVAWCRQDLVLLGSPSAADVFLQAYQRASGVVIADVRAWDAYAAAQAVDGVEDWAPNYRDIGRTELTGEVLRRRLDSWIDLLVPRPGSGRSGQS